MATPEQAPPASPPARSTATPDGIRRPDAAGRGTAATPAGSPVRPRSRGRGFIGRPELVLTPAPADPADQGLSIRSLSRRFGARWVLVRVSVEVPRGGALLLVGHNGSGKTTLLRCLATALRAHDGEASFEGRPLWANRHTVRRHIALLSHETALYDDLSARENLRVWSRMGGYSVDLDSLLDRVGLTDTGTRRVGAFSAGMRRRLALARALLKSPRLVLFDEPFSALDPEGRALMGEVLRQVRASGATLVMSTHSALGARYCDHAIKLEAGRVVWRGSAAEAATALGEA